MARIKHIRKLYKKIFESITKQMRIIFYYFIFIFINKNKIKIQYRV
jgi:hypothetical protein